MAKKFKISIKSKASSISTMNPKEAAEELKKLLKEYGNDYVFSVLDILQDLDRNRHHQDDSWWLEMMFEAGDEISNLF